MSSSVAPCIAPFTNVAHRASRSAHGAARIICIRLDPSTSTSGRARIGAIACSIARSS
jgi:hypothetical protein